MGKKIGKSILKPQPPKPHKPTKKELETWEEYQKELLEQKKAQRKEQEEEVKLPKVPIPSEAGGEEKKWPFRILPPLEESEVEAKEVPDLRLRTKRKTRIDIKEVK